MAGIAQPETLQVVDSTAGANSPAREHEIQVGDGRRVVYSFKHQSPVRMPFDHAMRFRPMDSFIVLDDEGERYEPNPVTPPDAEIELAEDEVVARYEELTAEALFARAKELPGSDDLKRNSQKTEIIAFLVESSRSALVAEDEAGDGEGEGSETMMPEEIAAAFPGADDD